MLSKSRIKLITSLKQKKYRNQHQLFVVEGIKTINEFLNSDYTAEFIYTTKLFKNTSENIQFLVTEKELQKISFLKNNHAAVGVFKIKQPLQINNTALVVALDNVRDPGNLGTIIRLCDWFGVTQLICNTETVDCYNPKVVQATMGSLTRVQVNYTPLRSYLSELQNTPIYGAFMDGENIYTHTTIQNKGVLVLGNEANGISAEIEEYITQRISIPQFGNIKATESLNVAMATSILLSEFKRKAVFEK